MGLKLKYTPHFADRMSERGFDIDNVKKVINSPEKKKAQLDGNICVSKNIDGKTLEVIYRKEQFADKKEQYVLITAYYIEK